jgi:hypothetical protein
MPFRESAVVRAVLIAVTGALAFGAALVMVYGGHGPTLLLTERGMAAPTSGFYPIEHADGVLFVWTAQHASIALPDIDRRFAWRLHTVAHNWRPPGVTPTVRIAVDGVPVLVQELSDVAGALDVRVPPHYNRSGAVITIDTDPPFVPGPGDRRALGVALESTTIVPAQHPRPPRTAVLRGMAAVAAIGAGVVLVGAPMVLVMVLVLGAGLGTVASFVYSFAAHGAFPLHALLTAAALSAGSCGVAAVLTFVTGHTLSRPARVAVALSAVACYLKLLVLLHPAAPIGDGVFHAHRLESVLGGRFFFTSLAPGDYTFPYPVFLYIVSAPFSMLARDTLQRMDLLRIVVTVSDAVAGALLYPMIVRPTGNRIAGVVSVAWYHVIPMTAWIMTWGNLTNAFGQALFVAALAAAVAIPVTRSRRARAVVAMLAAAALLSHPSTCAILAVVLGATAATFWWSGERLREASVGVGVAGAAAAVFALVTYYAWFPTVYAREFTRIAAASGTAISRASPNLPMSARIMQVPELALDYLGWPALVIGAIGFWRLAVDRVNPMVGWLIAAWVGSCVAFLLVGIVTPVQMRTYFALFPAFAVAAAFGSVWAWRHNLVLRAGLVAIATFALWLGVKQWTELFG